jgi:hypothetical protein
MKSAQMSSHTNAPDPQIGIGMLDREVEVVLKPLESEQLYMGFRVTLIRPHSPEQGSHASGGPDQL